MNQHKKQAQTTISREVAQLLKQIEAQRQALEMSINRINQLRQTPLEMSGK
ncbi:MAG: hypothetical protein IPL28_22560 [Chloroflexi bacterium]|nr:hypothetical protein [Chloroflexota bacterium]MDA0245877.1 hypothetical protein [Chloroflexota bacterium]